MSDQPDEQEAHLQKMQENAAPYVNKNTPSVDKSETNVSDLQAQSGGELREEAKATILRPLADKFQELTRQIDSGEYRLPKTIQEAEAITERYIDQAWERLEQLIASRLRAQLDELEAEGLEDWEQDIFRNAEGDLVCSTCNEEVFGGLCGCSTRNEQNDQWRALLAKKRDTL